MLISRKDRFDRSGDWPPTRATRLQYYWRKQKRVANHSRWSFGCWTVCYPGISFPSLPAKQLLSHVKIAKLNGYKVLASCSPPNNNVSMPLSNTNFVKHSNLKIQLVEQLGADATFDYKTSASIQLAEVQSITGGNFSRVFDASAQASSTAFEALLGVSTTKEKFFTTTDDWYVSCASVYLPYLILKCH